jgi:hypothetical protein
MPFAYSHVVAVGGAVRPDWEVIPPRWLPEEFYWVIGCSYRGLPVTRGEVRNPIGANMAFRRKVFTEIGGFHAGVGRIGTLPAGCEETELCIRLRQRWPDAAIMYEPRAVVLHQVPRQRLTWRYFRSRCYAEGRSKAMVTSLVGASDGLASERPYTLKVLPTGAFRALGHGLRHADVGSSARAFAIGAGLAMTSLGYILGRLTASGTRRTTFHAFRCPPADSRKARDLSTANKWLEFNFHDYATMRVARQAPTAALLTDMFAPFLTSQVAEHHDLTVTGRIVPISGVSYGETEYEYTDQSLFLKDSQVQILRDEDGWHLNGTRELLVSAVPLLDRILTTRGVAMIHAATVAYHGRGICIPAWGGTGKTSTIAKLLKRDGFSFMGDDWAFLADDARLLGYAKPMFIKPHHRPIYPHLFQKRRKPLVPVRFTRPLGRLTTLVHPFVTKYPRFARVTRKFSPEHMMVTPRQAFPTATITTEAPLALTVFVERFAGDRAILNEKSTEWMVSRMIGNFHAEIARQSQEVVTALGAAGLVPIERTFGDKAAVLRAALADKPTYLLQVPQAFPPDQASDVIVAQLEELLERLTLPTVGLTAPDKKG